MIKYKETKKKKLNIGCGYEQLRDYMNIDLVEEVFPDMVVDIEKGIPFKDNSFIKIYSEHCLEHIRPDKWKFVLKEIYRVAKDGCIIELKLPFDNIGQRTNADHYRTFSWDSFRQFEPTSSRDYYSDLTMTKLNKTPNKLIKLFFYLFPFLKYEVYYKFKVVKKNKVLVQGKAGDHNFPIEIEGTEEELKEFKK